MTEDTYRTQILAEVRQQRTVLTTLGDPLYCPEHVGSFDDPAALLLHLHRCTTHRIVYEAPVVTAFTLPPLDV